MKKKLYIYQKISKKSYLYVLISLMGILSITTLFLGSMSLSTHYLFKYKDVDDITFYEKLNYSSSNYKKATVTDDLYYVLNDQNNEFNLYSTKEFSIKCSDNVSVSSSKITFNFTRTMYKIYSSEIENCTNQIEIDDNNVILDQETLILENLNVEEVSSPLNTYAPHIIITINILAIIIFFYVKFKVTYTTRELLE